MVPFFGQGVSENIVFKMLKKKHLFLFLFFPREAAILCAQNIYGTPRGHRDGSDNRQSATSTEYRLVTSHTSQVVVQLALPLKVV